MMNLRVINVGEDIYVTFFAGASVHANTHYLVRILFVSTKSWPENMHFRCPCEEKRCCSHVIAGVIALECLTSSKPPTFLTGISAYGKSNLKTIFADDERVKLLAQAPQDQMRAWLKGYDERIREFKDVKHQTFIFGRKIPTKRGPKTSATKKIARKTTSWSIALEKQNEIVDLQKDNSSESSSPANTSSTTPTSTTTRVAAPTKKRRSPTIVEIAPSQPRQKSKSISTSSQSKRTRVSQTHLPPPRSKRIRKLPPRLENNDIVLL